MSADFDEKIKTERFWELDFVRGVSIFCMVIFHWIYQLYFVFEVIEINEKFFYYVPKLAAVFFILLGISLYIGVETKFYKNFKDVLIRSLMILGLGMGITGATLLAHTGFYIYFGVLHCHGVSTFLSYFFTKINKWLVLISAVILISLDFFLHPGRSLSLYFLFNNYLPSHFGSTFDYFPLIPNFGYALLGIFLGKQFYTNGRRQFRIFNPNKYFLGLVNFFDYIGKKTLLIYIIHVPVLFLLNDLIIFSLKPECCINIFKFLK
ncbi:MAG: DUF1624 domain-containing protein [Cytophagales bacterium]|jgi:uncharacterized membrane protein|nr:DUF1624 domain-containing protein [Cytophagales bacterium]